MVVYAALTENDQTASDQHFVVFIDDDAHVSPLPIEQMESEDVRRFAARHGLSELDENLLLDEFFTFQEQIEHFRQLIATLPPPS